MLVSPQEFEYLDSESTGHISHNDALRIYNNSSKLLVDLSYEATEEKDT